MTNKLWKKTKKRERRFRDESESEVRELKKFTPEKKIIKTKMYKW